MPRLAFTVALLSCCLASFGCSELDDDAQPSSDPAALDELSGASEQAEGAASSAPPEISSESTEPLAWHTQIISRDAPFAELAGFVVTDSGEVHASFLDVEGIPALFSGEWGEEAGAFSRDLSFDNSDGLTGSARSYGLFRGPNDWAPSIVYAAPGDGETSRLVSTRRGRCSYFPEELGIEASDVTGIELGTEATGELAVIVWSEARGRYGVARAAVRGPKGWTITEVGPSSFSLRAVARVAPDGTPHLVFAGREGVHYARFVEGVWVSEELSDGRVYAFDLAIDSQGTPSVALVRGARSGESSSAFYIQLMRQGAAGWIEQTAPERAHPSVPASVGLRIDAAGEHHLLFAGLCDDKNEACPLYARGPLERLSVAPFADLGPIDYFWGALELDAEGAPHVAYYLDREPELFYASKRAR